MKQARGGTVVARVVLVLMFGCSLTRTGEALAGRNINYPARPPFATQRERIAAQLLSQPGQHVLLVRYQPDHDVNIEWVYNGPNIDAQRVIWAHDLGDTANSAILRYYQGHHFWLVRPDGPEPLLAPYKP